MYSLVLATMLTAGSATPAWIGCHGCCGGCHGCYGSCYGCYGCHGCWGGCYGCYGSCYGCCGGCWGCYGSCYGCCGGCWGCHGCYGYGAPVVVAPVTPVYYHAAATPAQAKVVVQLPNAAKLYVDGELTDLTSATRTFATPALQADRDYFYTVKAETVRDGKVVSQTKRVVVQAGQTARVDFGDLSQAQPTAVSKAEAAPARVTVQLPEDATLSVNGVPCPLTSATRSFQTPKLEAGRSYAYTLHAEVTRDGQRFSEDRRVVVEAGKPVTVDFGSMISVSTAHR